MFVKTILLCFLLVSGKNCMKIYIESDSHGNENEFNECALILLEQVQRIYLIKDLTLVNTDDHFTKYLFQIENVRFTVRSSTSYHNSIARPDAYFIVTRNCEQLRDLIDILDKDLHWNPRAKFTISIQYSGEPLQCVADVLLINNLFNVNIISKTEGVWKVYSLSSEVDSCNRPVTYEMLSDCSDYNGQISMYNIKNYKSFKGCQIKLVAHNFWPYTNFKNSIAGIDQYIHSLLLQYTGINTTFIQYGKDEDFGMVFENFTFIGMLSLLQRKDVDGAIGGFYINENRHRFLTSTYPYLIDHVYVIVRRAPKLWLWQAVVRQLGTVFVALTAAYFIGFCIIAITLSLFSNNKRDYMREIITVYCYFLNIACRTKVSHSVHRFIAVNMVIFVLWIVVAVQACLLSAILHPMRDYQIKYLEEVREKLHPILIYDMFPFRLGNETPLLCESMRDCMKQVKEKEGLYSIVSNIAYQGEVLEKVNPEKIPYKTSITCGTLLAATMFRRGSPMRDAVSTFNGRLESTGVLLGYWSYLHQTLKLEYGSRRIQQVREDQKIEQLQNVFYLYIAGIIISLLVFACELIVKRYSNL